MQCHIASLVIRDLHPNQPQAFLVISYQAKKTSLRKVKTDTIDAYQLCVLYYKEAFEPHKIRGIQLLDFRNLSRQQEIVTNMYVEAKLQFHTILDQVFPEYRWGPIFKGFFIDIKGIPHFRGGINSR
ncbi:transposase [Peribacillus simplex]